MKYKYLTIAAILCLGLVIWINLFLPHSLHETSQTGHRFIVLIEGFLRAFIASFIFYTINIYLKERREKKLILPIIAHNVLMIVVNNHSIIACLKDDSKLSLDYYPKKEEFKELLSNINSHDKLPFIDKNSNWIYLFRNRQKSTLSAITKILASGKHLDDELRTILLRIQSSLYLQEDYAFNSNSFEGDLSNYYLVFYKHFNLINQLKSYYDKHLKSYYTLYIEEGL